MLHTLDPSLLRYSSTVIDVTVSISFFFFKFSPPLSLLVSLPHLLSHFPLSSVFLSTTPLLPRLRLSPPFIHVLLLAGGWVVVLALLLKLIHSLGKPSFPSNWVLVLILLLLKMQIITSSFIFWLKVYFSLWNSHLLGNKLWGSCHKFTLRTLFTAIIYKLFSISFFQIYRLKDYDVWLP